VRRNMAFFQRRALAGSALHACVRRKETPSREKRCAAQIGEHWPVGANLVGLAPAAQPLGQGGRDRDLAFFASFAMQANDAPADILPPKLEQLGDTGAGVYRAAKETGDRAGRPSCRLMAPRMAVISPRLRKPRTGFDRTLDRDGQNLLQGEQAVGRVEHGRIAAKERSAGQTHVPGSHAIVALGLQVVREMPAAHRH